MNARPSVSVVMPFAGSASAADEALRALRVIAVRPGDERILVDNAGLALSAPEGIEVVAADAEHSPAHARNAGAARAHGDWVLFLDADCVAPADLLDRYFLEPVAADVGALVGEVVPAGEPASLAERYGAARSFLGQAAHLAHPYLPRAAAANLLVRRAAFEQLGGFYAGLRAAEDTDFSWRLQRSGWRLELRTAAHVEHRYRASVGELRRQWRGYAAGRAWLRRRYPGFTPEPAALRALRRAGKRVPLLGSRRQPHRVGAVRAVPPPRAARPPRGPREAGQPSRGERVAFLAVDALLAGEELAGFVLSNRPAGGDTVAPAEVVLVAEHFPAAGDPLVAFALTIDRARVEASGRPERVSDDAAGLRIDYREDDGTGVRLFALARLLIRHPLRCALDRMRRGTGPTLSALAPAVARLKDEPQARLHGLGGEDARRTAARLASLSGSRHEAQLGGAGSVRR
jgi:hypothetical protein